MDSSSSKKQLIDISLWADLGILILANLITIYFYVVGSYSVSQVLLTYFIQTVLITVFYYQRIHFSNLTQITALLENKTSFRKRFTTIYITSQEQFFYLLALIVPIAFVFYIVILNLDDNASFGSLIIEPINYMSVIIASVMFLLHHVVSYFLHIWNFKTGRITEVSIPYLKLVIRVYTILAIIFISPLVFQNGLHKQFFYIFLAVKTFLDIFLSGSYALIRTVFKKTA